MTTVKLTNNSAYVVRIVVLDSKEAGAAQKIVNVAIGATVEVESALAAMCPDLYVKVANGLLTVTAGSMPTQVYPSNNVTEL